MQNIHTYSFKILNNRYGRRHSEDRQPETVSKTFSGTRKAQTVWKSRFSVGRTAGLDYQPFARSAGNWFKQFIMLKKTVVLQIFIRDRAASP